IGEKLQESSLTSGKLELSRGINAGLLPLIVHLYPDLATKLNIDITSVEKTKAIVPTINKEEVKNRISTQTYARCPFLHGVQGIIVQNQPPKPSFFQTGINKIKTVVTEIKEQLESPYLKESENLDEENDIVSCSIM